MISNKELKYVDVWAQKTPMPGVDYSLDVLNQIEICYQMFKEKYKDKEYEIIFSNSEEIEFEILSKNLCHMMGIDYKNIMSEYFDNYRKEVFDTEAIDISSYDLLELILEKKEKVAELDNDVQNRAKAINYYKSAVKCAIFTRLSNFEKFNFAAINQTDNGENSKLLFVPSNEAAAPYFMMGIKPDSNPYLKNKHIVYTLLAPESPQDYFNNQEVIIPTQILVSNNDNLSKLLATPEEKLQLITMYQSIIHKYGLPNRLNIYGDYEATLNDLANKRVLKK